MAAAGGALPPLYLGLDVGTQSTKALLFEAESGEVVGRGARSYGLTQDRPGQAEQDPATWLAAVKVGREACGGRAGWDGQRDKGGRDREARLKGTAEAAAPACLLAPSSQAAISDALDSAASSDAVDTRPAAHEVAERVAALALSGQQHGLVALDAEGRVIRPAKLWCDVESAEEAQELSRLWDSTVVPSFTATKLLFMKRREPENWCALVVEGGEAAMPLQVPLALLPQPHPSPCRPCPSCPSRCSPQGTPAARAAAARLRQLVAHGAALHGGECTHA